MNYSNQQLPEMPETQIDEALQVFIEKQNQQLNIQPKGLFDFPTMKELLQHFKSYDSYQDQKNNMNENLFETIKWMCGQLLLTNIQMNTYLQHQYRKFEKISQIFPQQLHKLLEIFLYQDYQKLTPDQKSINISNIITDIVNNFQHHKTINNYNTLSYKMDHIFVENIDKFIIDTTSTREEDAEWNLQKEKIYFEDFLLIFCNFMINLNGVKSDIDYKIKCIQRKNFTQDYLNQSFIDQYNKLKSVLDEKLKNYNQNQKNEIVRLYKMVKNTFAEIQILNAISEDFTQDQKILHSYIFQYIKENNYMKEYKNLIQLIYQTLQIQYVERIEVLNKHFDVSLFGLKIQSNYKKNSILQIGLNEQKVPQFLQILLKFDTTDRIFENEFRENKIPLDNFEPNFFFIPLKDQTFNLDVKGATQKICQNWTVIPRYMLPKIGQQIDQNNDALWFVCRYGLENGNALRIQMREQAPTHFTQEMYYQIKILSLNIQFSFYNNYLNLHKDMDTTKKFIDFLYWPVPIVWENGITPESKNKQTYDILKALHNGNQGQGKRNCICLKETEVCQFSQNILCESCIQEKNQNKKFVPKENCPGCKQSKAARFTTRPLNNAVESSIFNIKNVNQIVKKWQTKEGGEQEQTLFNNMHKGAIDSFLKDISEQYKEIFQGDAQQEYSPYQKLNKLVWTLLQRCRYPLGDKGSEIHLKNMISGLISSICSKINKTCEQKLKEKEQQPDSDLSYIKNEAVIHMTYSKYLGHLLGRFQDSIQVYDQITKEESEIFFGPQKSFSLQYRRLKQNLDALEKNLGPDSNAFHQFNYKARACVGITTLINYVLGQKTQLNHNIGREFEQHFRNPELFENVHLSYVDPIYTYLYDIGKQLSKLFQSKKPILIEGQGRRYVLPTSWSDEMEVLKKRLFIFYNEHHDLLRLYYGIVPILDNQNVLLEVVCVHPYLCMEILGTSKGQKRQFEYNKYTPVKELEEMIQKYKELMDPKYDFTETMIYKILKPLIDYFPEMKNSFDDVMREFVKNSSVAYAIEIQSQLFKVNMPLTYKYSRYEHDPENIYLKEYEKLKEKYYEIIDKQKDSTIQSLVKSQKENLDYWLQYVIEEDKKWYELKKKIQIISDKMPVCARTDVNGIKWNNITLDAKLGDLLGYLLEQLKKLANDLYGEEKQNTELYMKSIKEIFEQIKKNFFDQTYLKYKQYNELDELVENIDPNTLKKNINSEKFFDEEKKNIDILIQEAKKKKVDEITFKQLLDDLQSSWDGFIREILFKTRDFWDMQIKLIEKNYRDPTKQDYQEQNQYMIDQETKIINLQAKIETQSSLTKDEIDLFNWVQINRPLQSLFQLDYNKVLFEKDKYYKDMEQQYLKDLKKGNAPKQNWDYSQLTNKQSKQQQKEEQKEEQKKNTAQQKKEEQKKVKPKPKLNLNSEVFNYDLLNQFQQQQEPIQNQQQYPRQEQFQQQVLEVEEQKVRPDVEEQEVQQVFPQVEEEKIQPLVPQEEQKVLQVSPQVQEENKQSDDAQSGGIEDWMRYQNSELFWQIQDNYNQYQESLKELFIYYKIAGFESQQIIDQQQDENKEEKKELKNEEKIKLGNYFNFFYAQYKGELAEIYNRNYPINVVAQRIKQLRDEVVEQWKNFDFMNFIQVQTKDNGYPQEKKPHVIQYKVGLDFNQEQESDYVVQIYTSNLQVDPVMLIDSAEVSNKVQNVEMSGVVDLANKLLQVPGNKVQLNFVSPYEAFDIGYEYHKKESLYINDGKAYTIYDWRLNNDWWREKFPTYSYAPTSFVKRQYPDMFQQYMQLKNKDQNEFLIYLSQIGMYQLGEPFILKDLINEKIFKKYAKFPYQKGINVYYYTNEKVKKEIKLIFKEFILKKSEIIIPFLPEYCNNSEIQVEMVVDKFRDTYTAGYTICVTIGQEPQKGLKISKNDIEKIQNQQQNQFVFGRYHFQQILQTGHLRGFVEMKNILILDKKFVMELIEQHEAALNILNQSISHIVPKKKLEEITENEKMERMQQKEQKKQTKIKEYKELYLQYINETVPENKIKLESQLKRREEDFVRKIAFNFIKKEQGNYEEFRQQIDEEQKLQILQVEEEKKQNGKKEQVIEILRNMQGQNRDIWVGKLKKLKQAIDAQKSQKTNNWEDIQDEYDCDISEQDDVEATVLKIMLKLEDQQTSGTVVVQLGNWDISFNQANVQYIIQQRQ